MFVRLVDRKDRSRSVDQMSVPLRERLRQVAGITVTHVGLLDAIGGNKPISLSIQGTDIAELQRLTAALMAKMAAVPGLVDLDTSMKPPKPTVVVDVKRDAASDLGRIKWDSGNGHQRGRRARGDPHTPMLAAVSLAYRGFVSGMGRGDLDTPQPSNELDVQWTEKAQT